MNAAGGGMRKDSVKVTCFNERRNSWGMDVVYRYVGGPDGVF
jgi:hypothetical protein